jgi:hypothetical protein
MSILEADVFAFTLDGEDFGALFEWNAVGTKFFCRWPRIAYLFLCETAAQ